MLKNGKIRQRGDKMAKKKKKKRLKWGRVFITFVFFIALGFGIYKGILFLFYNNSMNDNEPTLFEKLNQNYPTVIIDAGHGGIDAGANNGKLYEKNITLITSLAIGEALQRENIRVYYTRTDDKPIDEDKQTDLLARAKMSETYYANCYVSIHVNDFAGSKNPTGFEIYTKKDEKSKELAQTIGKYIENLNYSKNRGVLDGSELAVLRHNKVEAVLVELGYINGKDYDYLKNNQKLKYMGEEISKGIIEYLKKDIGQ